MSGDLVIRAPQQADHVAILSVVSAAFEREDEASLVEKLWAAQAMALEFAAEKEGELIGYCSFSNVTSKPAIEGLLLGLAPVAVAPLHQKQGVGKALVTRGLEACREEDAALTVVLGAPDYYCLFGFEPASRYNVSWAAMDAGDAFQLIDYAGVTGGRAHKIDYHSAFSEL